MLKVCSFYKPWTDETMSSKPPTEYAQVVYMLFGKNCVFTACQKAMWGSTINHAEAIIKAIAEQEGFNASGYRFFDLQTRTSYHSCWTHRPNSGDYNCDEIVDWNHPTSLTWWNPTVCPSHVVEHFREYVDGEPNQVLYHGGGEAQKLMFPEMVA